MADTTLIIEIPDHLYKLLMEFPSDSNEGTIENVLMKAVENGIPLKKGHGKIVDANRVLENGDNWEVETALMQTEAIIEADKI